MFLIGLPLLCTVWIKVALVSLEKRFEFHISVSKHPGDICLGYSGLQGTYYTTTGGAIDKHLG